MVKVAVAHKMRQYRLTCDSCSHLGVIDRYSSIPLTMFRVGAGCGVSLRWCCLRSRNSSLKRRWTHAPPNLRLVGVLAAGSD